MKNSLDGPVGCSNQPVNQINWLDVNLLDANSWNPNHVMGPEMKLLAFSMLKQGWIQPILVWPDGAGRYEIIDGFHRHSLLKTDKRIWAMTNGLCPVVVMEMTRAERMLLTIRINRAKGNHAAFKMHEIVTELVRDHGLSVAAVCEGIGADKDEVNVLLAENVFEHKKVDQYNHSKAWVPPAAKTWGLSGVNLPS